MTTYIIAENLCRVLEIPFVPEECLSDEHLSNLPKGTFYGEAYSKAGTAAARLANTGRKRPDQAKLMRMRYAKGLHTKPEGLTNKGRKFSAESKELIGRKSGASRKGRKRGSYTIKNRVVEPCPHCGKVISSAGNMKLHIKFTHG